MECALLIASWAALTLTLVTVATDVRAADAPADDTRPVINNGQDPTRPRTQLEVLYEFQNLPGRAPDSDSTFTLRAMTRVPFDEHWSGSLRIDVPLGLTNQKSSENPDGRFVFGMGDLLTQVAGIYTLNERWAFAAGSQFTFSTASRDTTGSGKYVALPGAVVRYMLPELSPGSFFAPEVLYQFDMGGDPHRSHLSDLQLQPLMNWQLPHDTFLNLFPSSDIRINLGAPKGTGRLFLPFDLLVGGMLTPRLVATLEVSVPLVKQFPIYDFKLEARVGYFFD